MEKPEYPMRINKYLAYKQYCTRGEADSYIAAGKVLVNGKKAKLGDKVLETDIVKVLFVQKAYRYFAYNKPRGVITHSPQRGEKDVQHAAGITGVFPVGRLDKDSQGLMVLTDDGRVTDRLLNPKYDHDKEYVVSVREQLPSNLTKRMEQGIRIEGHLAKAISVRPMGSRTFSIVLNEGKKHQIRRMCDALALTVTKLERKRVMNIRLGSLASGKSRELAGKELATFLQALGLR